MDLNPTERFSSRVEDYIRYRPSYPGEIISLLERECALRPDSRVADIGSGTGLLAQPFLRLGCEVFGVEPNADMRLAGERLLAPEPASYGRFHSMAGRAESTGLPDRSVDLIAAGQAFHWFDVPAARTEFSRILMPPGWVALVWNERLVSGRFLEEYEALLHRYAPEYARVDHRRIAASVMDDFFEGPHWKLAAFPNEQHLDLAGVLGRLHSSSYSPAAGSEAYARINHALTNLFAESQQDNRIAFLYETKLYYGRIGG